MSRKSLVPLNALAVGTEPTGQRAGDIYYNTVSNKLYTYNGTIWSEIAGAAAGDIDGGFAGSTFADTIDGGEV